MAINAISDNYLGGISYTRIDSEHEEIKRLLLALGLEVTGQKSVDKARLSQAQLEKEIEATQKATEDEKSKAKEKTGEEEISTEFGVILKYLNIRETENVQTDYRNAINELRTRFLTETDQAELTYLRNLKLKLDVIMQGLGYSTQVIGASEMTGASALGEMNKVMMLSGTGLNASGK